MRHRPAARTMPAVLIVLLAALLAGCSDPPPLTSRPTVPPRSAWDGYALTGWMPSSSYVLRIHPTAAAFTADVLAVAAEVTRLSGITFTEGPPATSDAIDTVNSTPEIIVTVGQYCPGQAVGCAEMRGQIGPNPFVIRDARVSVVSSLLTDQPVRMAVLLHELGHAVGLAHMPEIFLGRLQVMNPYIDASMSAYREGDINGLAVVGSLAVPMTESAHAAHSHDASPGDTDPEHTAQDDTSTEPPQVVIS